MARLVFGMNQSLDGYVDHMAFAPNPLGNLDAMHDAGVDLSAHVDLGKAIRPGRAVQRVNVDFPVDLLREIDQEAHRLGVTRKAFIKVRLADSLVKNQ